jgi:hypothetical protein
MHDFYHLSLRCVASLLRLSIAVPLGIVHARKYAKRTLQVSSQSQDEDQVSSAQRVEAAWIKGNHAFAAADYNKVIACVFWGGEGHARTHMHGWRVDSGVSSATCKWALSSVEID